MEDENKEPEKQEERNMSGLDTQDAVNSLLIRAGAGGGCGGGGIFDGNRGGGDCVPFGRVNRDNILASRQMNENGFDCTQKLNDKEFATILNAFEDSTRADQINRIVDGQINAELRLKDQASDHQREISAQFAANTERQHRAEITNLQQHGEILKGQAELLAGQGLIVCKIESVQKDSTIEILRRDLDNCKNPPKVICVDPCCPGGSPS